MIIPTSVTSIGDYFIKGCSSMKNVIIPQDIKNIGNLDFSNFTLLREIIIPRKANPKIIDKAFYKCKSLTKIEFLVSITHIGKYAFYKCESLKELTIPSTVKTIDFNAFKGCSSLKRITIDPLPSNFDEYTTAICTSLMKNYQMPNFKIDKNTIILDGTYHDIILPYDPDKENHRIKIIVVGETDVGKTCFIRKYINFISDNDFNTVAPSIFEIEKVIHGINIYIQIIDTAGLHRFYTISQTFFRGSDCCIVMFDLTNIETLEYTRKLFNDIFDLAGEIPTVLVGNKCDRVDEKINREKIDEISNEYDSKYFEASVFNNFNIDESFEYIIGEAYQKFYYYKIKEAKMKNQSSQTNKCNI